MSTKHTLSTAAVAWQSVLTGITIPTAKPGETILYQWGECCWKLIPPPDILTTGYGNRSAEDLVKALERLDTLRPIVVDIRLRPQSDRPEWMERNLRNLLGADNYTHIGALGNLNYAATKGEGWDASAPVPKIEIADMATGIAQVEAILAQGRTPVLLCGCGYAKNCHRTVVAKDFREYLKADIRELDWPERAPEPKVPILPPHRTVMATAPNAAPVALPSETVAEPEPEPALALAI